MTTTMPGPFFIAILPRPQPALDGDEPVNMASVRHLVTPTPPETAQEIRIFDAVRSAFHAFYLAHGVGEDHAQLILGQRSYVRLCCAVGRQELLTIWQGMPIVLDVVGDPDRVLVQPRKAPDALISLIVAAAR